MELPACNSIYSNEYDAEDVSFLNNVVQFLEDNSQEFRAFYVGLCYYCNARSDEDEPLLRCSGCQLVGYCSRDCQKNDWNSHKSVCKEFPLVKGKNALRTKGSWKRHLTGLRERAARLLDAKPIFRNPRVCNTCHEPRLERLTDCYGCMSVSYCSTKCIVADKFHVEACHNLDCTTRAYGSSRTSSKEMEIKSPIDECKMADSKSVCLKFRTISDYHDLLGTLYMHIDKESIDSYVNAHMKLTNRNIAIEILSYPMSLLYALQSLPERLIGQDNQPLEDLTTLDIHVVSSSPLFHSKPWELFMHRLPNLKNLNIIFVMQGKTFKQSFNLNTSVKSNLRRCKDCEIKNRIITYSVKQMHYHMFFSSKEYTRPDAVMVYGNATEMSILENDLHSEISYSNMTYSRDTVQVLMDVTKDLVSQGVHAVNAARPVDQVVLPQINPLNGICSNRAELGSAVAINHDNSYFTCLRRKL